MGMKKYSREVTEALKRDEVTRRETESAFLKNESDECFCYLFSFVWDHLTGHVLSASLVNHISIHPTNIRMGFKISDLLVGMPE